VIIRQAGIALLGVERREQPVRWRMAGICTKDLPGPLEALVLMAMVKQPLGDLEPNGDIVLVLQQAGPKLHDLVVLATQACRIGDFGVGTVRKAGELECLTVVVADLVVKGIDLNQERQTVARFLIPALAQVDLAYFLERISLPRVCFEGLLEIPPGAVDIPLLERISSESEERSRVAGFALEVSQEFVIGLVESTSLAQLLGQAKPRLVEVGIALEGGSKVLDGGRRLGVRSRQDLVAPHVGLRVFRSERSPNLDRPGGLIVTERRKLDSRQLARHHVFRRDMVAKCLFQNRLGFTKPP
jgi:hypothetical protein